MADIYLQSDAFNLLNKKHILFIGDSNIRALYKDLVWLLQCKTLINVASLKSRLEHSFLGDELLERSELTKGRNFVEHRLFQNDKVKIEFYFITRCFGDFVEGVFKKIKNSKKDVPDVILMNSCLWDICRWGPNGVKEYRVNMNKLMVLITNTIPKTTLFIWATTLPVASTTSGGLIIKQIDFIQAALRIHVMEANKFASSVVSTFGFDVIDFHHSLHYQIMRRSADGIHFLPPAVRFLTNLLLTHIALSWDVKLPGNLKNNVTPLQNEIRIAMTSGSDINANDVKKIDGIAKKIAFANNINNRGKNKKKYNNNREIRRNRNKQFREHINQRIRRTVKNDFFPRGGNRFNEFQNHGRLVISSQADAFYRTAEIMQPSSSSRVYQEEVSIDYSRDVNNLSGAIENFSFAVEDMMSAMLPFHSSRQDFVNHPSPHSFNSYTNYNRRNVRYLSRENEDYFRNDYWPAANDRVGPIRSRGFYEHRFVSPYERHNYYNYSEFW